MARDAFLFCPCSRRLELIRCGQIHSDWANQQAQTSFGGPHPLLLQTKKNLSFQTGFLNMVGERGLPGSASLPCGPLLKQRCLAALGSNLLRRSSSSFTTDEKKPVFSDRFLKYGRRERIRTSDPLVPNQLRYQAALLADGGACYCDPRSASTAFCAFAANRLESARLLIIPHPIHRFGVVITAVSPGWSPEPDTSCWPD